MMRIESPLEQYKKSLAAQLQNIKKLNIVQKSNPFQESIKNFDSIAESNLSFLIDLGYDKLGQSTLEKVNTALNREYQ